MTRRLALFVALAVAAGAPIFSLAREQAGARRLEPDAAAVGNVNIRIFKAL